LGKRRPWHKRCRADEDQDRKNAFLQLQGVKPSIAILDHSHFNAAFGSAPVSA
jgi:hypothetical protein